MSSNSDGGQLADRLIERNLVAPFDTDRREIGIYRKIVAVADDDAVVHSGRRGENLAHFSLENGPYGGSFIGCNVDPRIVRCKPLYGRMRVDTEPVDNDSVNRIG